MADRTSSTVRIEVPAAVIMGVVADFAAYPQWASGVRAAEVVATGTDSRPERVRFTLDQGPIKDSYVLGYTWHGDSEVRWELAERGAMISDLSGAYLLEAAGAGTEVTYQLAVGLAVPMPGFMKRQAERTIIGTALQGLKRRAEAVAGR
jgi:hypothetical protein